jgi:hypothetical protein
MTRQTAFGAWVSELPVFVIIVSHSVMAHKGPRAQSSCSMIGGSNFKAPKVIYIN